MQPVCPFVWPFLTQKSYKRVHAPQSVSRETRSTVVVSGASTGGTMKAVTMLVTRMRMKVARCMVVEWLILLLFVVVVVVVVVVVIVVVAVVVVW